MFIAQKYTPLYSTGTSNLGWCYSSLSCCRFCIFDTIACFFLNTLVKYGPSKKTFHCTQQSKHAGWVHIFGSIDLTYLSVDPLVHAWRISAKWICPPPNGHIPRCASSSWGSYDDALKTCIALREQDRYKFPILLISSRVSTDPLWSNRSAENTLKGLFDVDWLKCYFRNIHIFWKYTTQKISSTNVMQKYACINQFI